MAMTRPAPGPGNLRRPLWLPRAFRPDASAYVIPETLMSAYSSSVA
jgi:hypothetical protein